MENHKYNDMETRNLFEAFNSNNIEMLRIAIKNGADPNSQTKKGVTPLMLAVKVSPWMATIDLLLDSGADINFVNKKGMTILAKVCCGGFINEKIVEHLINRGADVNFIVKQQKKDGSFEELSILDMALRASIDDRIINILKKHKASYNAVKPEEEVGTKSKNQRFQEIWSNHGIEVPKINIPEQKSFEDNDKDFYDSFYTHPNPSKLLHAIYNGADPTKKDDNGEYIRNKDGCTVLHMVCAVGGCPAAKKIIDDGCDVDVYDNQGRIPLMVSLFYPYMTNFLIESGADINHQDIGGHTPLFYAFNLEQVKLLLKNGADINLKNIGGEGIIIHNLKEMKINIFLFLLWHKIRTFFSQK